MGNYTYTTTPISNRTDITALSKAGREKPKIRRTYTFCQELPCPRPIEQKIADPCQPCDRTSSCVGQHWENDCCSQCGGVGGCGCQVPQHAKMIMPCPPGSAPKYPTELFLARSPLFSDIFSCFSTEAVLELLEQYSCYKLCGCNSAQSLVLATAHFITMLSIVQVNINSTTYIQSSQGKEIQTFQLTETFNSKGSPDFHQHWGFTTYGMAYRELQQMAIYRSKFTIVMPY